MRIFAYLLAGLVALLLLLLLAVVAFVKPNDYKARIAQGVKSATGRELTLQGDIKLAVFPWLALELGPVSLGNPQDFSAAEPFVSAQRLSLRVKLLPLLRRKLQVGRVEIDGLDLRLSQNAAGRGNWEDFGQTSPGAEASGKPQRSGFLPSLDGLSIKDGRVHYDALTLSHFNLEVGKLSQRATVPVKTDFELDTGAAGAAMSLSGAFSASLDFAAQRYELEAVKFGGELKSANSGSKLAWQFVAPVVKVVLSAQTLEAPAFSAQAGAAQISGSLAGDKIVAAPEFKGALRLEPLKLRDFLAQQGIVLPKTQDGATLAKFSASTDFAYTRQTVSLTKLVAQLDQTQLQGSAAVTNLKTRAMTFDLRVDHIDLDRYLAPPASAAHANPAPPGPLPTTSVRTLDARGNLGIGQAKLKGLTLANLQLTVQARAGVVHLFPLRANLYGGTYSGDITYDARDAVPKLSMEQTVNSVDMAPLLRDSMKSERFSGHGSASARLAGAGATSDALTKNLSGRIEMSLASGAVNGVDLWYEIARAQALLRQQSLPPGSDDHRTKFDAFRASADIAGGIATTKDLTISSPYLRITGGGTANLASEAISYRLVATVLKAPPAGSGANLAQLTLAAIPVDITGTAGNPVVRPDLQGLLKSQLKQKLQDALQDKLKGLFGK